LIVDYIGVFRNLQKALAIYATPAAGAAAGDRPIESKQTLVALLKRAIAELTTYCANKGIDLAAIQTATGFAKTKLLDDAVEALITSEEQKKEYLAQAGQVTRIYKAILPDAAANEVSADVVLFSVIARKIRALTPTADISEVMQRVEELLDRSIAAEGYVIEAQTRAEAELVDLSQIDFGTLAATFTAAAHKRTETEKLRGLIAKKLSRMIRLNPSRLDYQDRFQKLIDDYNAGSINLELFFAELMKLAQSLNEEEKRAISENLSEEELALFDILTRPEPKLSKKEEQEVKKVAKELLEKLKWEKLVIDWRLKQQTRAAVKDTIEETLDRLPTVYTKELYDKKCDLAYKHIYSSYFGPRQSIYQSSSPLS
jgi:type I restriction enzyme R subunit